MTEPNINTNINPSTVQPAPPNKKLPDSPDGPNVGPSPTEHLAAKGQVSAIESQSGAPRAGTPSDRERK